MEAIKKKKKKKKKLTWSALKADFGSFWVLCDVISVCGSKEVFVLQTQGFVDMEMYNLGESD